MAREATHDNEGQVDIRAQMLRLLLDRIDQDTYPSSTMLDTVEGLLNPDDVATYARVLMSKIAGDVYPSHSLIGRVIALG